MVGKHEIDFTVGPLLKKIIIYALPIIGVNVLQLLFTAADVAVLGIFTTDQAVAAVGATSAIINLLINFFIGLSVATNILVARCVGKRDEEGAKRLVGTAVCASIIFGFIIMVIGIVLSKQILIWTDCAPSVLPYATTYLRIYFLGMPIVMLYNFCASILRAVGDTLRPLIFLIIGGVVNVGLNVFFVTVVGLDVEGVAIATVSSQAVSAVCSLVVMSKSTGYSRLDKKHIRIYSRELKSIFRIGIPLGLTKVCFAFSNVVISAGINGQGEFAMAGSSIAKEFDMIIAEVVAAFSLSEIAVISQNLGAKKPERIKKTIFLSLLISSICGLILGPTIILLGPTLCAIMTDTPIVIEYAMIRLYWVAGSMFIAGMLNTVQEAIRGLGYAFISLWISIITQIGVRIVYMKWIYPALMVAGNVKYNFSLIFSIYPISWLLCIIVGAFILVHVYKKIKNQINNDKKEQIN